MKDIQEKIDDAKGRTYRGQPIGVPINVRIPPLILEGVLAFMKQNGSKDMTDAIVELLQEGIINAGSK